MDNPITEDTAESISDAPPAQSAGKLLNEARIQQGLSVADVAGRIKFAPRQVEALEADDFSHLPELAFVRGFVRSYARLLQLDESAILAALPQATQSATPQNKNNDVPFPTPQSERRLSVVWLSAALGLAVILAVVVLVYHNSSKDQKVVENKQSPATEMVVQPLAVSSVVAASAVAEIKEKMTPAPVSAVISTTNHAPQVAHKENSSATGKGKGLIHLVFHTESWVEIKDKSDNVIFHQVNQPNTEQWVDGTEPFSVVIGNASGVELYYDGEKINLPDYTKVEVARLILE